MKAAEWGHEMRIEWTERYAEEQIHVIADETPAGFSFAERGTWDTCWLDVAPTPDLCAKASYFLEAAEDPAYDGPYVFRRKLGDPSVIRVVIKPGCDLDSGRLQMPARDRLQPAPEHRNPWIFDSFYLFGAVVIVLLGAVVEKIVDRFAPALFILSLAPLLIILLTTFRLIYDGRLTQGRFLKIVLEALRFLRIPVGSTESNKRGGKLITSRSRKQ